jgi:hypothetical protein
MTVDELFVLCGGSTALMGQILSRAKGGKDVSKFILETINGEDREMELKQPDENGVTRVLRAIVRRVLQAQPSA